MISAILLCYNQKRFIKEQFRSLGKLIFRSSFLSKFNLDSGFGIRVICPALFFCACTQRANPFFSIIYVEGYGLFLNIKRPWILLPGEWEIIISDDFSQDGSFECLEEMVEKEGEGRRIILLDNPVLK